MSNIENTGLNYKSDSVPTPKPPPRGDGSTHDQVRYRKHPFIWCIEDGVWEGMGWQTTTQRGPYKNIVVDECIKFRSNHIIRFGGIMD